MKKLETVVVTPYIYQLPSKASALLCLTGTAVSEAVELNFLRDRIHEIADSGANLIRAQMLWYNNTGNGAAVVSNESITDYRQWLDATIGRVQLLTEEVAAINVATGRDIRVVIDLHTPPGGGQELRGEGGKGQVRIVNTLFEDPNASETTPQQRHIILQSRNELVESWAKIASEFTGNEVIYGYDLLNEPGFDPGVQLKRGVTMRDDERVKPDDPRVKESNLELWQGLVQEVASATVSEDPAATLIIEGRRGNDALTKFRPLDKVQFPNVIYSFHEYIRDEKSAVAGIQSSYNKRIRDVRQWQLTHEVPIYVGEFDAREGHGSHSEEQKSLLRNITAKIDEYNWDWTFHDFTDPGTSGQVLPEYFDRNAPEASQNVNLAQGILTISGSNNSDSVLVTSINGRVSVSLTGLAYERHWFYASDVNEIRFQGFNGADVFKNQTSIASKADGGRGKDTLIGGHGPDTLSGGSGNDLIHGGGGMDTLHGGAGIDQLFGDADIDWLYGGDDADRLVGGPGNDYLHGGRGNDTLLGQAGNDTLEGRDGDDRLEGGDGNDVLYGNAGNDAMYGQSGNDAMFGETGNDTMRGGHGNDFMRGDQGNDHLDGGHGNDHLQGSDGNDYVQGSYGNDFLEGGAGNDNVRGGAGVDSLYGNGGNDLLSGGSETDYMFGGRGDDRLYGDSGNDYMDGGHGNDSMDGRPDSWWAARKRRFRGWIWR